MHAQVGRCGTGHLSADRWLQSESVLADLEWLTVLYRMLEMLEVYGARALYAYIKSIAQTDMYE